MSVLSTIVRAVTRAVVAVVLAVGIWLGVYAVGDAVGEDAAVQQFVFLLAAPVVVLALLLYEVSRPWRWRRHGDAVQEPEQGPRKIARAVVAVLVAGGIWAGAYAYAVDLSRDNWWGAAIVFIGPPVAGLASLIYLKLPRRRSG